MTRSSSTHYSIHCKDKEDLLFMINLSYALTYLQNRIAPPDSPILSRKIVQGELDMGHIFRKCLQ